MLYSSILGIFKVFYGLLKAKPILIIILASLIVQTMYFIRIQSIYPPYGLTTEHYYSPIAINLLNHGEFATGEYPNLEQDTKRPPLYTVFVAAIYGLFKQTEEIALIFNNLFHILTIWTTYLIGRRINKNIGLIAAILFAIDPIGIINANKNQAESMYGCLFALFFLSSLSIFSKKVTVTKIAICSILLGIATLTRAPSLYLIFPLSVAFFIAHKWYIKSLPTFKIVQMTIILVLIQGVLLGSWMTRNYAVSGNPEFAGMSAIHLHGYFAPLVIGKIEGIPYREAKQKLKLELKNDKVYNNLVGNGSKQRYEIQKALQVIFNHPIDTSTIIIQQIPIIFINYPLNSATIFLSSYQREKLEKFTTSYLQRKSNRLDISGYLDIIKFYFNNGLSLILIHGAAYKIFYTLFMLGGAVGTITFLSNPQTRPVGIIYLVVIMYLVLIYSTWPSGRLRISLVPIYAIPAAVCFFNAYKLLSLGMSMKLFGIFKKKMF